jgi:hypothetical protein
MPTEYLSSQSSETTSDYSSEDVPFTAIEDANPNSRVVSDANEIRLALRVRMLLLYVRVYIYYVVLSVYAIIVGACVSHSCC